MPLPEGYRPRDGDVVLIRVAVCHDFEDDDQYVHVKPNSAGRYGSTVLVKPDELTQLVSRQWEEGMPVRNASDHSERGTVVTTFDEWVVIKPAEGVDGGPWILSNIEVEDDPPDVLVLDPDPPPIPPPAPMEQLVPREVATEEDDVTF